MKSRGQIAYETYCEKLGWIYCGDRCSQWSEVDSVNKALWEDYVAQHVPKTRARINSKNRIESKSTRYRRNKTHHADPVFGKPALDELDSKCKALIKPFPTLKPHPGLKLRRTQLFKQTMRYIYGDGEDQQL